LLPGLDSALTEGLRYHHFMDFRAGIASGSFLTGGMAICPCSMGTAAAIANGLSQNLIHRAADVILKERRTLVLAVRESPFNDIHLENMLKLSRMGAIVLPPMPAFYNRPRTVDDIVDHTVSRVLDQFGLDVSGIERWSGEMGVGQEVD
jgi:4-hydroxy-3-polyprenylbenzoate decarboxylase